jgi:hypothetical protein
VNPSDTLAPQCGSKAEVGSLLNRDVPARPGGETMRAPVSISPTDEESPS